MAAILVAAPAWAQAAPAGQDANAATPPAADEGNTIVVTGIKASLQKSLDVKRDAPGVVDAISAEDIGKFPDADLASAIQRVPGVSVSRGASSQQGVTGTIGEATEITVRGFGPTFNETLVDGRALATGTNDRGFDFSSVGSDFVKEVDILKTPDATLSDGAIGATINIKLPTPFDHRGPLFSATVSGSASPDQGKVTPVLGALFSDTFDDDKIGVLLDFAYSDHKTRTNHIDIQGWEGNCFTPAQFAAGGSANIACPVGTLAANGQTQAGWFIQDYGIYQEQNEDKRYGGRAVLQFRPTDNIEVTLNDDYSRDTQTSNQYGFSVWFNSGSMQNITQNPDGTITNFVQNNSPTDFQGAINSSVLELNEMGANLKWTVSPHFTVVADYDRSLSKLNPGGEWSQIDADVGYGPSSPTGTNGVNIGIAGIGAGMLPYPTSYGPNGNTAAFINNGIIGSHVIPIGSQRNRDEINQATLEGRLKDDNISLDFGFNWRKDDKLLSEYDDFTNNDWQAYSGYGPASNNPGGVALPQNLFGSSFSTANFINGFSGAQNLPAQVLAYNPYPVLNYLQSLNGVGSNAGCCTPAFNGTYQIVLSPGSYQHIVENVYAFFLQANTKAQIGSVPIHINFGLRAEETDLSSTGIGQEPTSLTVQASDHTAFLVGYGPQSLITSKNSYRNILPNIDIKFDLTPKLLLRLDASRTLTRPPLNYLTPVTNVGQGQRVGSLVATGGNPNLKPYTSDNLDLGLEYYYARNSYLAIDGFAKQVSDFIVGGTVTNHINGVIDPTTGQLANFSVTSQVNGPSALVYGLEASIQHVFGDTGFGLQANATLVGTNRPYDPSVLIGNNFAVTGLADSANGTVFFEKYGFSARVAVNYRAAYIDHFGQRQANSLFGAEPVYVNKSTTVDASLSYAVNHYISVFAQGNNLTGETYSTHGRFADQLLDIQAYGPSYTAGFRVKF